MAAVTKECDSFCSDSFTATDVDVLSIKIRLGILRKGKKKKVNNNVNFISIYLLLMYSF